MSPPAATLDGGNSLCRSPKIGSGCCKSGPTPGLSGSPRLGRSSVQRCRRLFDLVDSKDQLAPVCPELGLIEQALDAPIQTDLIGVPVLSDWPTHLPVRTAEQRKETTPAPSVSRPSPSGAKAGVNWLQRCMPLFLYRSGLLYAQTGWLSTTMHDRCHSPTCTRQRTPA